MKNRKWCLHCGKACFKAQCKSCLSVHLSKTKPVKGIKKCAECSKEARTRRHKTGVATKAN